LARESEAPPGPSTRNLQCFWVRPLALPGRLADYRHDACRSRGALPRSEDLTLPHRLFPETPRMSTPDPCERRRQFRALHQAGCFILPNPWDPGSARYLQSAGFKALASTSAGHAWSQGKADGAEDLEQVLAHLRELSEATALPLN